MKKASSANVLLFVILVILFMLAIIARKQELGKEDFHIRTEAICQNRKNLTFCEDKLIVTCGQTEYVIAKNPDGFFVHEKNWKDPRITR